jgi:NAD(P)-dependent dehydrogenase (short-subunit alcohol dehydrogenase family)
MLASFSLEDRVAIVTGASRGIGAAIARVFVGAGAKVVLAARKAEALQQLAQGGYWMTEAAVISMTRTFAVELAGAHIRVNAFAPGLVDTRLASALVSDDALSRLWLERTPIGRVANPDEIAGAALDLASDASSYVTGQVLVVDGGTTIA